jgi:hypothetical protein
MWFRSTNEDNLIKQIVNHTNKEEIKAKLLAFIKTEDERMIQYGKNSNHGIKKETNLKTSLSSAESNYSSANAKSKKQNYNHIEYLQYLLFSKEHTNRESYDLQKLLSTLNTTRRLLFDKFIIELLKDGTLDASHLKEANYTVNDIIKKFTASKKDKSYIIKNIKDNLQDKNVLQILYNQDGFQDDDFKLAGVTKDELIAAGVKDYQLKDYTEPNQTVQGSDKPVQSVEGGRRKRSTKKSKKAKKSKKRRKTRKQKR